MAAVLGLLVVILVLATMSGPQVTRVPFPDPTFPPETSTPRLPGVPSATAQATGAARQQSENGGGGVLGLIFAIVFGLGALVVLALLAVFLVRRLPRLRLRLRGIPLETMQIDTAEEQQRREERAAEEVRSAVQAGIDQLEDESADPRRAVIACWLRLEATAAEAGTGRAPGDTPAELVQRMLTAHRASDPALQRLARLYRMARYGPAEIDPEMRATARDTLARLRTELARPPEPEHEPAPEPEPQPPAGPDGRSR